MSARADDPPPARPLFVAAGGGGDAIAATILQRKLAAGPDDHFVATYSWDRLLIDPLPGPRDPSSFKHLERFGVHNHVITGRTTTRRPAGSLLPRLARDLSTSFFLLDPRGGALGIRQQLAELVDRLGVDQVYLVDSGGDILARGDEPTLRSPLADSLMLAAAADDIHVPVDVLVTAAGLDGELSATYVEETVSSVGGDVVWSRLEAGDVDWCRPLLTWHPSEVNGLLVAAAQGFRGTVEIRDAALRVQVVHGSAAVHRCSHASLMALNQLAKSMIESTSLIDADRELLQHLDFSEVAYQRKRASLYADRTHVGDIDARVKRLVRYSATRPPDVDALSLRRAAEVMEVGIAGLHAISSVLADRFPDQFRPPLWFVR